MCVVFFLSVNVMISCYDARLSSFKVTLRLSVVCRMLNSHVK